MRLNRKALVALLVGALFVSGLAGAAIDVVRFFKQIPQSLSQKPPGEKFMPLLSTLRGEESVGFISDTTGQAYVQDLYQAQHVLAPIIIQEGEGPRFTIVNSPNTVRLVYYENEN